MKVYSIRASVVAALLVAGVLTWSTARAAQIVYPIADGTLADGGVFGRHDGIADSWNWAFGPDGFAGAVTLTTETPANAVEHRMVCEYDLRGVTVSTPLVATLTLAPRGVSVFPFPDVTLHVYSYTADLLESPSDFSVRPAVLQGAFSVTPMQEPKIETLDVTALVESALTAGTKRLAFRFQIDPNTPHPANQVFIDARDSAPATKPYLTIHSAVPGDIDDDGDADLADFAILTGCLAGPEKTPAPTTPGVAATDCQRTFDRDADGDVDLDDLSDLLGLFVLE
jgi:hypothetical protein